MKLTPAEQTAKTVVTNFFLAMQANPTASFDPANFDAERLALAHIFNGYKDGVVPPAHEKKAMVMARSTWNDLYARQCRES